MSKRSVQAKRSGQVAQIDGTISRLQKEIDELRSAKARLVGDPVKGTSDSWCSPPEIAEPLMEFFDGSVDVDPCSNDRSIIHAMLAYQRGGLVLPWRLDAPIDYSVYQNDPYSQAEVWTRKALFELDIGNVREWVRLSMMSTSAQWWSDMCLLPEVNPRILALKRIAFLDPAAATAGTKRQSCRFEPALTYVGHRPERFTTTFAHLTRWATWGR